MISSNAAPALLGRLLFVSGKQLKTAAHTIGAVSPETLFTGHASKEKHLRLPEDIAARARRLAGKLVA